MKQSCTERLTGVFKRGHQALTLEAMALQDSCVNPGFLLSLPARQTQISATTSQTGGLLPLLCLLSCAGFVSVYRTLLFLLPGCFLPLLLFGFFLPTVCGLFFVLCLSFTACIWRFSQDWRQVTRWRWGSYLRKSHVSCHIVSRWCQHAQQSRKPPLCFGLRSLWLAAKEARSVNLVSGHKHKQLNNLFLLPFTAWLINTS